MFLHQRIFFPVSLSYPRTLLARVVHPDTNLEHLRDLLATQDCAMILPSKPALELLLGGEVDYSVSFLFDTAWNNGRFEVYIGIMADANNASVVNDFCHRT